MISFYRCISLIIFSIVLHFAGYYILFKKIEPFLYFFYIVAWWSYIFLIDGLLAIKAKRFFILNKYLPLVIAISCGFWCFFEIINLRLQNWFYVSLPEEIYYRYIGYLFAFGTVIPAIYVTQEAIINIIGNIKVKPFGVKNYPKYSISIGAIIAFLVYAFPDHFFAFTWIFLALILDGYNYQRGYASFMRDFEEGNISNFLSALASGFVCGLLWETWNSFSVSKWMYSVPLFENLKIFEMPAPGYVGFLAFGLETITFLNFLNGIKSKNKQIPAMAVVALVFSILAFALIDRNTVFSMSPSLKDIDFIQKERLDRFMAGGARTSYGININLLSAQEKKDTELLHLKGLGLQHFIKLKKSGIKNINDLSKVDEKTLSIILGENNMRRIRAYLESAKKEAGVNQSN